MTRAPRPDRLARLAVPVLLLAALAAPLGSAQHGPPPGYKDPVAYAQDYAADQAAQAQNDTVGYAAGKATPEALANETEHAAWLACWTLHEHGGDAAAAADPVCAAFFTPPGQVDPPAEAEAEITEAVNGTVGPALNETGAQAFLDEALDAVNDTLADPATVVEQLVRIVEAAVGFAEDALAFVLDLVMEVLDLLGLGVGAASVGALGALDGLLSLLALPVAGLASAVGGVAALAEGAAGGAVAAVEGAVAFAVALASGLASAAGAAGNGLADGLGAAGAGIGSALAATGAGISGGAAGLSSGVTGALDAAGDALAAASGAVGDGMGAATGAIGDAVSGAAGAVGDALDAVGDAVSSLFGGGPERAGRGGDDGLADGVRTGTEADGLLDQVLGLV
jgi:hypothetical protein